MKKAMSEIKIIGYLIVLAIVLVATYKIYQESIQYLKELIKEIITK